MNNITFTWCNIEQGIMPFNRMGPKANKTQELQAVNSSILLVI